MNAGSKEICEERVCVVCFASSGKYNRLSSLFLIVAPGTRRSFLNVHTIGFVNVLRRNPPVTFWL